MQRNQLFGAADDDVPLVASAYGINLKAYLWSYA
jgi:hypothetical protein